MISASARKQRTNPCPTALMAARGISVTEGLTLKPWKVATTEMITPKTKLFTSGGDEVPELQRAQERAEVLHEAARA